MNYGDSALLGSLVASRGDPVSCSNRRLAMPQLALFRGLELSRLSSL